MLSEVLGGRTQIPGALWRIQRVLQGVHIETLFDTLQALEYIGRLLQRWGCTQV
jgi:hypothetical protein